MEEDLTGVRIHEELQGMGIKVGYSTVKDYLAKIREGGRCLGSLTKRTRYTIPPRRMNTVRTKTKGKLTLSARNPPKRGDKLTKGALIVLVRAI